MENISDEYHRRNSQQHADDDILEDDARADYHHERNNSLPELFNDDAHLSGWEKYWSKNGERLIWQTWIDRYIDYINPDYLSKDGIPNFQAEPLSADGASAFSFESKDIEMSESNRQNSTEIIISPPARLSSNDLRTDGWNPLSPASTADVSLRRPNQRASDIDNLLSPRCESVNSSIPRTIGTVTDSMTNVTRMTISSYDFCSSRVSSESTPTSTPTDSNSVSSFSDSEESDNPMTTRLSADCEKLLMDNKPEEHVPPPTGKDSEEYWQKRWQNHAQEQYVKHYNEFMEAHRMLQQEMNNSFKSDSGSLPGEGFSKFHKQRRKKSGRKKNHESLQRLVANLNLKTDLAKYAQKQEAPTDGSDPPDQSDSTVVDTTEASLMESLGLPTGFGKPSEGRKGDRDGGDEPPEDRPVTLKRSHESDSEEPNVDRIKSHFELMGFAFGDQVPSQDGTVTAGDIVYRKKHVRLHNRMLKMMPSAAIKPKHSYFDDDGNEVNEGNQQETEMILHTSSDEDGPPIPPSARINIPFTSQLSSDANPSEDNEPKAEVININLSIDQENEPNCVEENAAFGDVQERQPQGKKEKKKKRKGKFQSSIPLEIANDRTLKKFWYKRFSLFSMFDYGIRLDRGKKEPAATAVAFISAQWSQQLILTISLLVSFNNYRKLVLGDSGESCELYS